MSKLDQYFNFMLATSAFKYKTLLLDSFAPNLFVSRCTDSPIEQKSKHETVGLCYQIFTGTAPQYLAERG